MQLSVARCFATFFLQTPLEHRRFSLQHSFLYRLILWRVRWLTTHSSFTTMAGHGVTTPPLLTQLAILNRRFERCLGKRGTQIGLGNN